MGAQAEAAAAAKAEAERFPRTTTPRIKRTKQKGSKRL